MLTASWQRLTLTETHLERHHLALIRLQRPDYPSSNNTPSKDGDLPTTVTGSKGFAQVLTSPIWLCCSFVN